MNNNIASHCQCAAGMLGLKTFKVSAIGFGLVGKGLSLGLVEMFSVACLEAFWDLRNSRRITFYLTMLLVF